MFVVTAAVVIVFIAVVVTVVVTTCGSSFVIKETYAYTYTHKTFWLEREALKNSEEDY